MTYSISVYAFSQQFMMKFPPSPPPLSNIFVSKQKFQMRFLQSKLTDRHIEREKLCTRIIANVSFQLAYILREKCVCCAKSTYFKMFTHWKLNISQTAEEKKICLLKCFIDENNIRHYRKKNINKFRQIGIVRVLRNVHLSTYSLDILRVSTSYLLFNCRDTKTIIIYSSQWKCFFGHTPKSDAPCAEMNGIWIEKLTQLFSFGFFKFISEMHTLLH